MKKTLIAAAALSTMAASAMAANVTLYGAIDTGLVYTYQKAPDTKASNSVTMDSSVTTPSRWGIKGDEKLAKGYSVSFRIENGFGSDSGAMGDSSRLFNRESRLTLNTPAGEFSFGRMGAFTSSAGYYDLFMGLCDIYDGGWGSYIGGSNFFGADYRWDNMITYGSPTLAGFTAYLQYSGKHGDYDADGVEGRPSANRYTAIALTYAKGPLNIVAVYDAIRRGKADGTADDLRHSQAASLGMSYDFGGATLYINGQYGKKQISAGGISVVNDSLDGFNAHIGLKVAAAGGDLKLGAYYTKADCNEDSDATIKTYNLAATYEYPLSKRTYAYAGAGYLHQKGLDRKNTKTFTATIGLAHNF